MSKLSLPQYTREPINLSLNLLMIRLNHYLYTEPDMFFLYELMVIRINKSLESLPF